MMVAVLGPWVGKQHSDLGEGTFRDIRHDIASISFDHRDVGSSALGDVIEKNRQSRRVEIHCYVVNHGVRRRTCESRLTMTGTHFDNRRVPRRR
jgi:hypothetical protein